MYHTETLRYLTEEPKSILFLIVLCGMVALAIVFGFVFFNHERPDFAFSKRQIAGVAVVSYLVLFIGFMFHRDTVMEHNQDATIHYMVKLDDNRRMQLINQANELPEGDYVKALVIQAETYFK
jgi:hypothetical protein